MTTEGLNNTLVADFRSVARRDLDLFIQTIKTGEVRRLENPFTGAEFILPIQQKARALREKLADVGLSDDEECVSLLLEIAEMLAVAPVFSLAAAFDGEGALPSGTPVRLAVSGEVVDTYIHEIMHSA